jgi:hypothetical protein
MRKTVSASSRSFRFIRAIWNSYSKSDTARRPRMIARAPRRAVRSTRSPSNTTISIWRRCRVASRIIWTRSSSVNSAVFAGLVTTATTSSSKSWRLRSMRSRWPFVSGSNEPG